MRDVSQNADNPEILVDDEIIQISSPTRSSPSPRPVPSPFADSFPSSKTAAMLVFHNQASFVNVAVGRVGEEYQNTDYEKFNKSMCQLMDSMEIMMHVPTAKPSDGADASSTTA